MSAEDVFGRWARWTERVYPEFVEMADDMRQHRRFVEVVEQNPRFKDVDQSFIDWIARSYVAAAVVGVRRHVAGQNKDLSVETALKELQEHAKLISWGWYRAKWAPDTPHATQTARRVFESFGVVAGAIPDEDHLDPDGVASDLKALQAAGEKVVGWANAHLTHLHEIQKTATWGDLRAAQRHLLRVFAKYHALLTLRSIAGFEPVEAQDTLAILEFPWICCNKAAVYEATGKPSTE